MTESHFDNDLAFETQFAALIKRYEKYEENDVFGKTFRGYSKNHYDTKLVRIFRMLSNDDIAVQSRDQNEEEMDPMDSLR